MDVKCENCQYAIWNNLWGEFKCDKKKRKCTESEVIMGCSDYKQVGTRPDDPTPEIVVRSGATFTPHVSDDGLLSWTNDKGLENPKPVNLKPADGKDGKDGHTPVKGVDYFDGKDGYTPVKGVDYFDGKDGYTPVKGVDYVDGKDGYTPVKGVDYVDGKDGLDGKDGVDGKDGYTPVKGVDYFDGQPGKDGVDGKDGLNGKDGYSPVKGVDYFDGTPGKDGKDGAPGKDGKDGSDYVLTEADKQEIAAAAIALLPVYDGEVKSV